MLEGDFTKSPKYDKLPSVYQKFFPGADLSYLLMCLLFYAHLLLNTAVELWIYKYTYIYVLAEIQERASMIGHEKCN